MASQSGSFFEHSRFGQKHKRAESLAPEPAQEQTQEQPRPSIKESWREDFRFSDDLAELERHQTISRDDELARHFQRQAEAQAQAAPPPVRQPLPAFIQTQPAYQEYITSEAPPSHYDLSAQQAHTQQAQKLAALERQIARLQAEKAELLRDNQIMAQQLETFYDRQGAEWVETEAEEPQPAKKPRYQKIWGKLHLLL